MSLKIENEKFVKFLQDHKFSLENFDKNIAYLQKVKREHINCKMSNEEAAKVGSVIFNIDLCLNEYFNSNIFKFIDLYEGIILSINSKNISSAITIARSVLEHFAMFSYKTDTYINFLKKKDFLKLSIDLHYWSVPEPIKAVHPNYKRTHIMDAIRFLDKLYSRDDKESKIYQSIYHNFSENVHPASNSICMMKDVQKIKEVWNNEGYNLDVFFTKETGIAFLKELFWVIDIVSYELVKNIIPIYKDEVFSRWNEMKEDVYNYFKENPTKANEIIEKTVNKQLNDFHRAEIGKENIDEMKIKSFLKQN